MDRTDRLRVAWVAALAVAVMAGVVASALHVRAGGRAGDGRGDVALGGGAFGSGSDLPATPRRRRAEAPLPAECEPRDGLAPAAELVLPEGRLDFGALRQGVVVERDVVVRNNGTGILCILDVATGCGCVKAEWVGVARVAPGGTGTLKVRIDTGGRAGIEDKSVTLYLNDPARPTLAFKVHLEVRLGLIVASGGGHTVTFGIRPVGKAATAPIRLRCPKDEPPWEVLGVESTGGDGTPTAFTWKLEPAVAESDAFREVDLVLTRAPSDRLGTANDRIRIRTSHPERPEILLDTQILVVQKYYTQPKDVRLLRVRRDGVNTRTVFVFPGEAGTPFRVTGARVEGAGFVAAEPRQVPEGWAVDVRYDGVARGAGRIKATLVVGVEDPELPEVRVPLEAEVIGS